MTIWAVFYRSMPLILKKSSIAYSDLLKELNWKYFEKEVFDTFAEPGYKKIVFMTIDDG